MSRIMKILPDEVRRGEDEFRTYAKLFSPEDVSADYKITLDVYNNLDNGIREAKDKRVNVANSTEFFAECLEVIAEAYEKVDIMQIESV